MYSAVWHNRQTAVLLEKFGVGHTQPSILTTPTGGTLKFLFCNTQNENDESYSVGRYWFGLFSAFMRYTSAASLLPKASRTSL